MSVRTEPTVVRIDDDHPDFDPELPVRSNSSAEPTRASDQPTDYSLYGGHIGKVDVFVKGEQRA